MVWSLIAGLFLAAGWAGEKWLALPCEAAIALFCLSYFFGAYDLVGHSMANIRKGKFSFDIDLLMLLAAVGAAVSLFPTL